METPLPADQSNTQPQLRDDHAEGISAAIVSHSLNQVRQSPFIEKQNFVLRRFPPPYPATDDGTITKSGLKTPAGNSDGMGQPWHSCRQTHLSKLWKDVWYAARRYAASIPLFELFGFKELKVKFYPFGALWTETSASSCQ